MSHRHLPGAVSRQPVRANRATIERVLSLHATTEPEPFTVLAPSSQRHSPALGKGDVPAWRSGRLERPYPAPASLEGRTRNRRPAGAGLLSCQWSALLQL